MVRKYKSPEREAVTKFINIADLAATAQKLIPAGGWGYISGGAGDEWTLRRNTEAFDDIEIYSRILNGVEKPEMKTTLLGISLSLPVIMAPVAAQKLAHISGEAGTAKGTAAAGTLMCISNYANETLEDIAAAAPNAPQWFQIYMSKEDKINKEMLDMAIKSNCKAIILTADATLGGDREKDRRSHFKMPFPMAILEKYSQGQGANISQIFAASKQNLSLDDIGFLASYTKLPIIVKGIMNAEDANLAIGAGASAVWVSNHGGRQLDGSPAAIEVLREVAGAVNKKVPIIFDSGIRRGQHIAKALAAGADVVAIGRPALYGLAAGGWRGVQAVFDFFAKELSLTMQLTGCQNIEELKKARLR